MVRWLYYGNANVDSGPFSLLPVPQGATSFSSAQTIFGANTLLTVAEAGGQCIQFNGTSLDVLTPGSSDFTFETWLYPVNNLGDSYVYAGSINYFNTPDFAIYINNSTGYLTYRAYGPTGTLYTSATTSVGLPLNTWSFVQFRRIGVTFAIGIGGTQQATTSPGAAALYTGSPNGTSDYGGRTAVAGQSTVYFSNGRLTIGVGRPFTLPSAPFPNHP